MTVILMRHGQDEQGYRGGWSSQGLTALGREQVAKTAESLTQLMIDQMISSDLLRALETADIIAKKCQLSFSVDSDLREINNGDLSGLDNQLAEKWYPGLYYNTLSYQEAYPNGESPADFFKRVSRFYDKLKTMDQTVLIITHGGVINALYCLNKQIPHTNKYQEISLEHGEYLIIEIGD